MIRIAMKTQSLFLDARMLLAGATVAFLASLPEATSFVESPRVTTRGAGPVDKAARRSNRSGRRDANLQASAEELSNAEISRYSRHLVLSDVGVAGQRAFKNASVLVVGAGGLGSPCLLYLAAAGVGYLGIVDADTVDDSNLQRQIIHGASSVGVSKCESAKRRIQDINPFVHVRAFEEELTSETVMRILGEGYSESVPWDVVVDGSDNFPTKYLINDACDIV